MAEKRFDFLQELVADVPDMNTDGDTDIGSPTPMTPVLTYPSPFSVPSTPTLQHFVSQPYSPVLPGSALMFTAPKCMFKKSQILIVSTC